MCRFIGQGFQYLKGVTLKKQGHGSNILHSDGSGLLGSDEMTALTFLMATLPVSGLRRVTALLGRLKELRPFCKMFIWTPP
jgi:hypothetical protein